MPVLVDHAEHRAPRAHPGPGEVVPGHRDPPRGPGHEARERPHQLALAVALRTPATLTPISPARTEEVHAVEQGPPVRAGEAEPLHLEHDGRVRGELRAARRAEAGAPPMMWRG